MNFTQTVIMLVMEIMLHVTVKGLNKILVIIDTLNIQNSCYIIENTDIASLYFLIVFI